VTEPDKTRAAAGGETAQTLHRGLLVLELLAESRDGLTVNDLAGRLSVSRTVVYRLLTTLAEHGLVTRDTAGRNRLGLGALRLARQARPQLVEVALPLLRRLADEVGATASLTVADSGEALAIAVVEPRHSEFHVAYRVGSRHPLDRGAAGLAILAGRPPFGGEPPAVTEARRRGYAVTSGHLQPGAYGVAAPVRSADEALEASVGVITLAAAAADAAVTRVVSAAAAVGAVVAGQFGPRPARRDPG
jgi:DNA-binding IclR family transcriptional regulator